MLNGFGKHVLESKSVLSDASKEYIDSIDMRQNSFMEGEIVYNAGDSVNYVHIVQQGWLTSLNVLANGGRQLLNFYTPNDLVGLEFLSSKETPSTLKALSASTLVSVQRDDFVKIMRESPSLMEHFLLIVGLQDVIMQERICSMSRMDAKHKIVYFLLLLKSKVDVKTQEESQSLFLPLTQYEIADSLGLTNVTVSKVMSELERSGYIQYKRQRIEFLNSVDLTKMVDFKDRYAQFSKRLRGRDNIATAA
ncbi:Crp/Fnr family transcriptional regulator [Litorimonas haliclonae]|uniref:Crp/Fnr family transcriptional regulator n=1 Tax=Litorimonas haliclonae TaxID=2081977 RepID=UPI0039F0E8BA